MPLVQNEASTWARDAAFTASQLTTPFLFRRTSGLTGCISSFILVPTLWFHHCPLLFVLRQCTFLLGKNCPHLLLCFFDLE